VTLPPSLAALEAGDVVAIEGQGDGPFVITALRDGTARQASLTALTPAVPAAITADRPLAAGTTTDPRSIPLVVAAHLPNDPASPGQSRLLLAASASPWPGEVTVDDDDTAAQLARLTRKASLGVLAAPIGAGPVAVWDDATILTVTLYSGHLASAGEFAVLAGANRLALQTDSGEWESIGFASAALTAPSTYRLTHLLRGQGGTVHAIGPASAGNAVIVLDAAVAADPVPVDWLGETLPLRSYAGSTDPTGTELSASIDLPPALPLAPVHLSAIRDPGTGDVTLGWIRCSRSDTDSWATTDAPFDVVPEAYAVTILDGLTPVRVVSAATPEATYSSAEQTADFGGLPANFAFTVAQLSPTLGPGLAATGEFDA
jgi:hypothetical protein